MGIPVQFLGYRKKNVQYLVYSVGACSFVPHWWFQRGFFEGYSLLYNDSMLEGDEVGKDYGIEIGSKDATVDGFNDGCVERTK